MKDKEQVIKDYCKAAELYFLKPWEVACSTEDFKEYNINKNDFVKVLPEDIYGAMVIGCENWKPKFELTSQEYIETLKREVWKLKLWKSISKINNKTLREGLIKEIENFKIKSWEELKSKIKMIKLIDR